MPAIPPVVLAAIAALATILPALIVALGVVLPILRPWLKANVSAANLDRLRRATKGAFVIVADIAKRTPTTLDDSLADVLRLVERELGVVLDEQQRRQVRAIALAMHADPKVDGKLGDGVMLAALEGKR
jgi:hypothetical protein